MGNFGQAMAVPAVPLPTALPFLRFNLMIPVSTKMLYQKVKGNFSEAREESGKTKVEKRGHPDTVKK